MNNSIKSLSAFEQVKLQEEVGRLNALVADKEAEIERLKNALFDEKQKCAKERMKNITNSTRMAMMEEALKKIISNPSVNHIHANGDISYLESALSTSPESLAAWEAEKLEPLQKQVVMLHGEIRSAIDYLQDVNDLDDKSQWKEFVIAKNKLKDLLANTKEAAEAFMREHEAKVLQHALDSRIYFGDEGVIDYLENKIAEIRAANKE